MNPYLLIVTSQDDFKRRLTAVLDDIDPVLVGFASSGEESQQLAAEHPPTVVLLDAESLPNASGLAHILQARYPESRLVLVPPKDDPQHTAIRGLQPDRYLARASIESELMAVLRELSEGEIMPVPATNGLLDATDASMLLDDLKEQLALDPGALPGHELEGPASLEIELEHLLRVGASAALGDEPLARFDAAEGLELDHDELLSESGGVQPPTPPERLTTPAEELEEITARTVIEMNEPLLEPTAPDGGETPVQPEDATSWTTQVRQSLETREHDKIGPILETAAAEQDLKALLLFNQGRVLFSGGALSPTDIQAVEDVLLQGSQGADSIDIARFLKLGESQEKVLLYAASILGAFGICTLNPTSRALSEIRTETLKLARQLRVEPHNVPKAPQAGPPPEPAREAELPEPEVEQAELTTEPPAPRTDAGEEALPVTLDDILSEDAPEERSLEAETDEWVRELPENEAQEPAWYEGDTGPVQVTGVSAGTDATQTDPPMTRIPEAEGLEAKNIPVLDSPTTEEPPPSAPITLEPQQEMQAEPGWALPQPEELLVQPEAPGEDAQAPGQASPTPGGADPLAGRLPKVGQGRYRVYKPGLPKTTLAEWQAATRHEKTGHVFRPLPSGPREFIPPAERQADLSKPAQAWKPGGSDPLATIRHRLKNQKPPSPVKAWEAAGSAAAFLSAKTSIKEAIRSHPELAVPKAASPVEAGQLEPPLTAQTPAQDLQELQDDAIEDAALTAEGLELTAGVLPVEDIAPPETLDESGVDTLNVEAFTGPDYQEELDGILHDIMANLSADEKTQAGVPASGTDEEVLMEEPSLPAPSEDVETSASAGGEDEVVILEENLHLLKEMAEGMSFEDFGLDKDADTFFEEYMARAGEQIDASEPSGEALAEETAAEETFTIETPAEESFFGPEIAAPFVPAGEEATPTDEAGLAEGRQPTSESLEPFTEEEPVNAEPEARLLTEEETGSEAIEPLDSDELNATLIELSEVEDNLAGWAPPETLTSAPPALEQAKIYEDEVHWEDFPEFDENLVETGVEPEPQLEAPAVEDLPTLEDLTPREEADSNEAVVKTVVPLTPEPLTPEAEAPGVEEDESDLHRILEEVLTEEPFPTPEIGQPDEGVPASAPDTGEEPFPQAVDATSEKPMPEEPAHAAQPEAQPETTETFLDASLLPWEKEEEEDEVDIERTPVPGALLDEDQGADVLVDLLADTRLDTVNLGYDQPVYTCILVPELTDFTITSKIGGYLREWLPRLARVFGWQLTHVLVQPTYLQWTVRVPSGTSQGSIVRKVRQQTSLRIFEEFAELKTLSPSGNFWAKGYLVVSGSNPPPAEFLDDFIQKNRRPKGIFGA